MSISLASDMARKSLDTFLEGARQQKDSSLEEVEDLLDSCGMAEAVLERLWQLVQDLLDRGVEGRRLASLLEEFLEVLEVGMRAFETAKHKLASASLQTERRAEGILPLDRAERRARQMQAEASELLDRLAKPMKHFDPSMLANERGNRDSKGFVSLEDLTGRLTSPKDA